jgi:hypothetical protein
MQLRRTAGLVVALFLIASAATADAECAWLLWAGVLTAGRFWGSTTEYVLVSGYQTHADCEAAEPNIKVGAPANRLFRPTAKVVERLCLPETVGPRGPKGGRR